MQIRFLINIYNVQRWPRGPSFVVYILDKSEQTAGKLQNKKFKYRDGSLKGNQVRTIYHNIHIELEIVNRTVA